MNDDIAALKKRIELLEKIVGFQTIALMDLWVVKRDDGRQSDAADEIPKVFDIIIDLYKDLPNG